MENKELLFDALEKLPVQYGAFKAKIIDAWKIETDKSFRDMCKANFCGLYGKCWMCPPDAGDIEELMSLVGRFEYALVYQTVSKLEDSFDYEGMVSAKKQTYKIAMDLRQQFGEMFSGKALHLGCGGCGVCDTCAKRLDKPCRFPELAMSSLEAYGINVSQLANASDMKYTNGTDTVTYFGAVLFSFGGESK